MNQTRNKLNINNMRDNKAVLKSPQLPNLFEKSDEIGLVEGICGSIILHVVFAFIFLLIVQFSGLLFSSLPKPEMPKKDIEFRLVQAPEKPPINKNTPIRSDRNSQAGGKHDPKRTISEPSPAPSQPKKPQVSKQPQKQAQKPVQKPPQKPILQPQKVVQKVVQKPAIQPPKKPTPIKAPSVAPKKAPSARPVTAVKPSAPKLATAPKSPFQIAAPSAKAPVGSTYRPQGASGGTSGGSKSAGAPAPKFSGATGSKGGSGSAGSSGSRPSARGTGGYGTGGNPSPGNPNGTPGIDAIKQPNWGPYMRDLEQRIKRNWSPPKGDSSKRVVITFTIGRDGRLLSHKVTKSSGVPLADRAAMSAIELTAPFRPLPPEFRGQSVPIEFTFDYNVLNSVLK